MSYTPTLIIKYNDLIKIRSELEEELYSDTSYVKDIAEYLLESLKHEKLLPEFEGTKIIVVQPDINYFNNLVRERLDEGMVYYITFV